MSKEVKALVWHLGSIKELVNCGLSFRGFKAADTLRWMHLKVRSNKYATNKVLRNEKRRCKVPVKYFKFKMKYRAYAL